MLLLLDALFSYDDRSLLPAEDFPLFAAFESALPGLLYQQIQGSPIYETRRSAWLISDHIALSGVGQFSR